MAAEKEPLADAVATWRKDTYGCEGGVQAATKVVHLNSAGAALMPLPVQSAVTSHFEREAMIGGYEAADERTDAVRSVYTSIARLLNSAPSGDEIALVESATTAWSSGVYAIDFKPGDVILTTAVEYGANYVAFMQLRDTKGVRTVQLPHVAAHGGVDASKVLECMRRQEGRVRLVAVTHIPTNGGMVNPCHDIGAAVATFNREKGFSPKERVLYAVDACQTVGQMPVDVDALRCDILSATSRKFLRGPRGAGFLYVRADVLPFFTPPTLDHYGAQWSATEAFTLHPTARRFEKWESSVAIRLGLGAAVEYALRIGLDNIWRRVKWLADRLRSKLGAVPGVTLLDIGEAQCGIVTFSVSGWKPASLKRVLQRRFKINTTVSTVIATRLDMERRGLTSLNRASVHYYNTVEELDFFLAAVGSLAGSTDGSEKQAKL